MKNLIAFLVAFNCFTSSTLGQIVAITYRDPTPAVGGCTWCYTPFPVCITELRDFYIAFDNLGTPSGCKLGSNPYRITLTFYKNNHQYITSVQQQTSGTWLNFPTSSLMNIPVSPGIYYAEAKFEVRRCLPPRWEEQGTYTSNIITVNPMSATPYFDINGLLPNSNGNPYQVCSGGIKLNAANTLCESYYYIGVQESNQWWDRTYDYEWGLWFSGQAPNNINLQQLATTYSYPPYFNGRPSRQGDPLKGGNIDNVEPPGNSNLIGQPRYYRIVFATGQPNWSPKFLLINVVNCILPNEDTELLNRAMDILATQLHGGIVLPLLEKPILNAYFNLLNKSIIVEYQLPEKDTISISIINSSGQKIVDVVSSKIHESGNYIIEHNSQELPAGVYTVVMATSKDRQEKQLIKK